MNQLQDKASLDEKSVQAIAKGEVTPKRQRRKPSARSRSGKVELVQPAFGSPLIPKVLWVEVEKILASGRGYTRWEIRSDQEVVVR